MTPEIGWLDVLKISWPFLVVVVGGLFTFLKFWMGQKRELQTAAIEATARAEAVAEKAHTARVSVETKAAELAAQTTSRAMASLEKALDRANEEIAQSRTEREKWLLAEVELRKELAAEQKARRQLSQRVDELERLLSVKSSK